MAHWDHLTRRMPLDMLSFQDSHHNFFDGVPFLSYCDINNFPLGEIITFFPGLKYVNPNSFKKIACV